MTIDLAVLGILSHAPLTGYDLKKIMQDSAFMPWSGNNNQIYRSLLDMDNKGFVVSQTVHQDGAPSKKVYTVTEVGTVALKGWLQAEPEPFETRNSFLVQLAFADLLSDVELLALLDQYEKEITGEMYVEQAKAKTGFFHQGRTPRETVIWELINENVLSSYQAELAWLKKLKAALLTLCDDKHNKA